MKAFIKQWILLFGFVVISAHVIPPIFNGIWNEEIWFIIKLLPITLIVCALNYLMMLLPIELPLLKHFASMCVVLATVFAYGLYWQWFSLTSFWLACAMVIPVYLSMALLDALNIKRDIIIINEQIERIREMKQEDAADDC